MTQTDQDNLEFNVDYKKSSLAKSVKLKINLDGHVVVTYPTWLHKKNALDFFKKNLAWVQEHIRTLNNHKITFQTGQNLPYKGNTICLGIFSGDSKRPKVIFKNEKLIITVNKLLDETQKAVVIKNTLYKWYKEQAAETITERVSYYNTLYGFQFNDIKIKDQKTRWGSCSSKKNLNFNWRLIKAPPEILDYVVVHELCHLKELNHSPHFWNTVQKTIPDYTKRKTWLKSNYHKLISF